MFLAVCKLVPRDEIRPSDPDAGAHSLLSMISWILSHHVIHRIFGPAQLNIEIKDRFGQPVIPREWFLVPLVVVDELVDKSKMER